MCLELAHHERIHDGTQDLGWEVGLVRRGLLGKSTTATSQETEEVHEVGEK